MAMVRRAVDGFGFCGIKVHRHDARISREICEVARELHLPVLYDPAGEVATAELIAGEFPDVDFVIPHLGSFADDWSAQLAFCGLLADHPNLYTDTSGVRRFDLLVRAVERAGPHKVLFGSDGPWLHPGVELAKVDLLGLPPDGRGPGRRRELPAAHPTGAPRRPVGTRPFVLGNVAHGDQAAAEVAVGDAHRQAAQVADVAGIAAGDEQLTDDVVDVGRVGAWLGLAEEVAGTGGSRRRAALAQARQVHRAAGDAVVEVAAERPGGALGGQVAVGRAHQAEVARAPHVAADALVRALLDDAQQFGLQRNGQLADLVEEQRAPVGQLERSLARGRRAGERAALVTEELAARTATRRSCCSPARRASSCSGAGRARGSAGRGAPCRCRSRR